MLLNNNLTTVLWCIIHLAATYTGISVFGMWAVSDIVCLELSFPPYCFVPLSLSGFLMNGKKHLKSNMSEQLALTKYNTNGFWLH